MFTYKSSTAWFDSLFIPITRAMTQDVLSGRCESGWQIERDCSEFRLQRLLLLKFAVSMLFLHDVCLVPVLDQRVFGWF